MRSIVIVLSTSSALALAIAACTVTTGSTGTTPVEGDSGASVTPDAGTDATPQVDGGVEGGACALKITSAQGPSCDKCLETACCGEVNACLTDSDCIKLIECVNGCDAKDAADPGDAGSEQSGCIQDCSNTHAASVNAYVDYSLCVVPACQTGAEAPCR